MKIIEGIKELKILKEKKEKLLSRIMAQNFRYSTEKMKQKVLSSMNYDFEEILKQILDINKEEVRIRTKISEKNNSTKTGVGLTISEALIELTQKTTLKETLEGMISFKRQISTLENESGNIVFEEFPYDFKDIQSRVEVLNREISKIQMAIDSANLSTDI